MIHPYCTRCQSFLLFFFFPFGHDGACGIIVSWAGIELWLLAVRAPSPKHLTSREFSSFLLFKAEWHSVIWMDNILLLHFYLSVDTWGASWDLLAAVMCAVRNIVIHRLLCESLFWTLRGPYLGVESLGHVGTPRLPFWGTAWLFSTVAVFFQTCLSFPHVVVSCCDNETYHMALTAFIWGGFYLWVAQTVSCTAFQSTVSCIF